MQLNIVISTQVAITDYPVKIDLSQAPSSFWNNVIDGTDIYFLDSNGNPLYYFIEYIDKINKKGVAWVKITLSANSSTTIQMYFGGSNPYSSYNTSNIFLLFDHFDGTSVDSTKWNVTINTGGSVTVSDSIITINNAKAVSKTSFSFPISVRAKAKFSDGKQWKGIHVNQNSDGSGYGTAITTVDTTATTNLYGRDRNNAGIEIAKVLLGSYADNNFHIFEENVIANNNKKFYIDETLKGSLTSDITITSGYIVLEATTPYLYVDYIIVRKFIDPEPTVSIYTSYQLEDQDYISVSSPSYQTEDQDYVSVSAPSYQLEDQDYLFISASSYQLEDQDYVSVSGAVYQLEDQDYISVSGVTYQLEDQDYISISAVSYRLEDQDYISISLPPSPPPSPPPQILCPEYADILSQEGYSWDKAIASLLCGLEAVLTELGNEISRSARTIGLVFIGVGFGYVLMRVGEKIIELILKGLRKSYEKKR
jgi:hypothetical protein